MTLHIDTQFIHTIAHRLENMKKKSDYTWNCRCPICGDSSRNKRKARGYFYRGKNDMYYKCHNCGASMHFGTFLKQFDGELYNQYTLERYADTAVSAPGRRKAHKEPELPDFKPKFRKKNPVESILTRLDELPFAHEAVQYAMSRFIPEDKFDRLFFIDNVKKITAIADKYKASIVTEEPRLAIPFFDGDKNLTAVSLRGMRGETLRYILVKVDEDASTIFGLDRLDKSKEIFVVEGPLDSLFLDNSIACAGTSFGKIESLGLPKERLTIIFDNQPKNREVCAIIEKYINLGFNVVIWPESVPGKDINEMIENGLTSDEINGIIRNNTWNNLAAKAKFSQWRKV